MLAGERDPKKLAALADPRVKQSQAQIEAALTGDYRPELLFVVRQALENYRQLQQQIAQCDLSMEKHLAALAARTPPKPTASQSASSAQGGTATKASKRRKAPGLLELSLAGHL